MKNIIRTAGVDRLLLSFALMLAAVPAHATDGYFLHGSGAKAKGMAGAGVAYPQDALAIASNPAAATEVGHRLDIGVDLFVPDRSVAIRGNAFGPDATYSGNGANPFVLPEFGYVRALSDTVAVGLAIYGNGGMNTEYKTNPFGRFGATGAAGIDLKQIFITPTLAYRIAGGHSIGISVLGLVQGFQAKGIAPFAAASSDPANFTDRGTSWSFGAGVRVGWLGHLTDRLTAGAFYQSKVWASDFNEYAGLFSDRGGFDVPASWGGGLAYRLTDSLDIAADVKRIEYSGVASVGTSLAPLFAGVPFGATDGPGFGWRDITVFKVGVAYDASKALTLRTGYGRSGQPVPTSQTFLNTLAPGVVQDHFTVGATWTAPSGVEVTAHALYAPRTTVQGEGSIPPGLPPGFGGGETDISLGEFSTGISIGLKF
jgi:long-chain fatty acid transport protein